MLQRWFLLRRPEDPVWKRKTEEGSRMNESYTAVLQTSHWLLLTGAFQIKIHLFSVVHVYLLSITLSQQVTVKKMFSWKGSQSVKVLWRPVFFSLRCLCRALHFIEQLWQCTMFPRVSSKPPSYYFFWKNPMIEACLAPLLAFEVVFFWLFFSSDLLPAAGFAGKGSLGACLVVWAAVWSSASEYDSLS